ncbi:MAG: DUF4294 domain-containing protein [Deinococcales bacterium]|nr:DUF4294 domain-containing protein [Chitinophagaceae bacterium]
MGKQVQYILLILFVFFGVCLTNKAFAQIHGQYDTIRSYAEITPEGDTIPSAWLLPAQVETRIAPKWKRYWAEWTRLRNAVYVTYPYAKRASKIMIEINAKLVNVTDKKQRKAIIREREAELRKEFTSKLSQLSVYQGKVLMKIIFRETGTNCYEIIDEYKGGFTAVAYQSILFFFGSSLKQSYDPLEKDKVMEAIVKDVEKMYGYGS